MLLDCTNCDGRCCKTPINYFHVVLTPKEIEKFKQFCKLLKTKEGYIYIF